MRHLILKAERAITGTATALACGALALAVLLAAYQVLMRYVIGKPSPWSDSVLQLLIVWMVYLGLAGTFRSGALVSVDLLAQALEGSAKRALQAAILLACLVVLAHMVWYGGQMVQRGASNVNPILGFAMSWGYLAVPVGGALAALAAIARFIDPEADAEGATAAPQD